MIPLATVKGHIALEHTADDALLAVYIAGAVAAVERQTERIVEQRADKMTFDSFPDRFEVGTPLVSVASIQYIDPDGVQQTLSPAVYTVVTGLYGSIELSYGQQWPQARRQRRAIEVNYTAGWTDETLPRDLRLALLILIAQLYENREPVAAVQLYEVPMSFRWMVQLYEKPQL